MSYRRIAELFPDRYVDDMPADANAFALQRGGWKFDYDARDDAGIRASINADGRPLYCAMFFPHFLDEGYSIWELGPSDGYNTAGLEFHGARNVTAIEGNAAAFMRCLIMKNHFGLRGRFLLGDFEKHLAAATSGPDLIYASGVLYHLTDPIGFLRRCSALSPDLFLWSFVYDADAVRAHHYERERFNCDSPRLVSVGDRQVACYERRYEAATVADPKYAGGFAAVANWLSRPDLEYVLTHLGYRIITTIDDSFEGIPAVNIFASRRQAAAAWQGLDDAQPGAP